MPFSELSYEAWKWSDQRKKANFWIFQGNPKVFDFETALKQEIITDWTVSAHKDKIKTGDKVILWITGNNSGCYALAEVTSEPHTKTSSSDDHLWKGDDKSELKADIKITHNLLSTPILKEQVDLIKELSDLKVGNQGTNFVASEAEFNALLNKASDINKPKYWLYSPGNNAEMWKEFYSGGVVRLGQHNLGNIKDYKNKSEIVSKLQELENVKSSKKNHATAYFEFYNSMSKGDIIIVKKNIDELLGYGVVSSEYFYDNNKNQFQYWRKVDWKKKGSWKTDFKIVPKTLTDITKYPTEHPDFNNYYERLLNLMNVNNMNFPLNQILYGPPGTGKTYNTVLKAAEIIENRKIHDYSEALKIFNENLGNRIEFITFHQNYSYEDFIQGLRPDVNNSDGLSFERKDGVFKRIATKALNNINASEKAPEEINKTVAFEEALETFKDFVVDSEDRVYISKVAFISQVEDNAFRYTGDNWTLNDKGFSGFRMKFSDLITFHEKGVRNRQDIKQLTNISGLAKQHASYFIKVYDKVLKYLTETKVIQNEIKRQNYVIIIDEINRANISRVFGELITLIEPDKRSHGAIPLRATLPSGDEFIVPSNLYIIGTMNTADKSIALLDIALRRRFEFEAMYPIYEIDGEQINDREILERLNNKIIERKGHDFQIGHSYFMNNKNDKYNLVERMNKKVIPLLLEYFMNDDKEVKEILKHAGLTVNDKTWPLTIMES